MLQSISLETVRGIHALGRVFRVLGQLERSEDLLLAGLESAKKLGVKQEEAGIYLNLGNTARAKSNKPGLNVQQRTQLERSALEYYVRSSAMSSRSPLQIQAKLNQLSLLVDRQKHVYWSIEEESPKKSTQESDNSLQLQQSTSYLFVN